jgi:hypothetical protein
MIRTTEQSWPCVGCGYCCIRQTCTFGIQRHPLATGEVCPELTWNGGRYVCRMMTLPDMMTTFYREQLQAGLGCRSYFNPWRKDVRKRSQAELKDMDY